MVSVLLVVPDQYVVASALVVGAGPVSVPAASPVNVLPPMPVTSGMAAGASTASPCVAEETVPSQSAAPSSPEAATMVWPWELACCAHPSTWSTKVCPNPDSQKP